MALDSQKTELTLEKERVIKDLKDSQEKEIYNITVGAQPTPQPPSQPEAKIVIETQTKLFH